MGARLVTIRLRVRRFFCDRKSCRRRTFAEQFQGLTERYRRASTSLKSWLRSIAVELGGRAGDRLCRRSQPAAGRTRLLGHLERPPVPKRSPHVLGVDEFAFRKGCTHGTVLVDVEASRVVDVLPDRTAETFATWLTEHPGAEIICRDRATAYTRAVKEAAPDALEVADRRHLLQSQFRHLMRVAVSVREGTISSSTLLKRLRSGSRKNATYAAFREVGRVIRTGGVIADNDPVEQEKAMKFNALLTNAVIFHNALDIAGIVRRLLE
ncbi:Tn3 family transposase [Streptomyces sp. NPDC054770]